MQWLNSLDAALDRAFFPAAAAPAPEEAAAPAADPSSGDADDVADGTAASGERAPLEGEGAENILTLNGEGEGGGEGLEQRQRGGIPLPPPPPRQPSPNERRPLPPPPPQQQQPSPTRRRRRLCGGPDEAEHSPHRGGDDNAVVEMDSDKGEGDDANNALAGEDGGGGSGAAHTRPAASSSSAGDGSGQAVNDDRRAPGDGAGEAHDTAAVRPSSSGSMAALMSEEQGEAQRDIGREDVANEASFSSLEQPDGAATVMATATTTTTSGRMLVPPPSPIMERGLSVTSHSGDNGGNAAAAAAAAAARMEGLPEAPDFPYDDDGDDDDGDGMMEVVHNYHGQSAVGRPHPHPLLAVPAPPPPPHPTTSRSKASSSGAHDAAPRRPRRQPPPPPPPPFPPRTDKVEAEGDAAASATARLTSGYRAPTPPPPPPPTPPPLPPPPFPVPPASPRGAAPPPSPSLLSPRMAVGGSREAAPGGITTMRSSSPLLAGSSPTTTMMSPGGSRRLPGHLKRVSRLGTSTVRTVSDVDVRGGGGGGSGSSLLRADDDIDEDVVGDILDGAGNARVAEKQEVRGALGLVGVAAVGAPIEASTAAPRQGQPHRQQQQTPPPSSVRSTTPPVLLPPPVMVAPPPPVKPPGIIRKRRLPPPPPPPPRPRGAATVQGDQEAPRSLASASISEDDEATMISDLTESSSTAKKGTGMVDSEANKAATAVVGKEEGDGDAEGRIGVEGVGGGEEEENGQAVDRIADGVPSPTTEDGESSDDSGSSSSEAESELTEEDDADFRLPGNYESLLRSAGPWGDAESSSSSSAAPFDPAYNCHGVVHVRLIRAQRLPIAAGTAVRAVVSLPPWRGRIKTDRNESFYGPAGSGVCLRWDRRDDDGEDSVAAGDEMDGDGDGSNDDGGRRGRGGGPPTHSMVHAYNNEDTPVPQISIELLASSLTVFESHLCSARLPCHRLLMKPGVWTRSWCPASVFPDGHHYHHDQTPSRDATAKALPGDGIGNEETTSVTKGSADKDHTWHGPGGPLILLEACFQPRYFTERVPEESDDDGDDTVGSMPRDLARADSDMRGAAVAPPFDASASINEDGSSLSTTARTSSTLVATDLVRKQSTKAHLLRVTSFWAPAWCSVCGSLLSGFRLQHYQCEACKINCCADCQLQVDVQLPCGSDLAKAAAQKAVESTVSVSKVMSVVAPSDYYAKQKKEPDAHAVDGEKVTVGDRDVVDKNQEQTDGIGTLHLRVLKACLFEKALPPEVEHDDIFQMEKRPLKNGDHYVRISWLGSKETRRTKTVFQASKPLFDSDEMDFTVAHYGMEYRIEVVDANTDKPVGTYLLSAQKILQWQRDELATKEGLLFASLLDERSSKAEMRRLKLELRTGVKNGFGLDFYNASKIDGPTSDTRGKARAGEISGWIEVDVCLEEDLGLIYSSSPRPCPGRETEDFNIELIQVHIARLGALMEDMQRALGDYFYLVSWKDPALTGLSMIIFIGLCLRFNAEYFGCLPVFFLVTYMLYLAKIRRRGDFKWRWIRKERDARIKAEKKMAVTYTIHRPVGRLKVAVIRGRNLRSRELGLPGSLCAAVYWDPLRLADEKTRSKIAKFVPAASCIHEIGVTTSSGLTSNPDWNEIHESDELQRLKQLLPDARFWRKDNLPESMFSSSSLIDSQSDLVPHFEYPVLQPVMEGKAKVDKEGEAALSELRLVPWSSSPGALVFQVRFSDVINRLPVFDNILGEVIIPLSKLVGQDEISGWFRLLDVGSNETLSGREEDAPDVQSNEEGSSPPEEKKVGDDDVLEETFPEIYLTVKLSIPNDGESVSDSDQELSRVIAEEMIRTATIENENKIGMIGSSLSTINTVRGLGGSLQNQLGSLLDILEGTRNAFNFSSPHKSALLLVCLSALWLVLALIPTRVIIFCGGMAQYISTFVAAFWPTTGEESTKAQGDLWKENESEEAPPSPIVTRLTNFFLAIPTDEDLRRTYFWEARRVGEREREKLATNKRVSRLERLWKAQWYGLLELKVDLSSSARQGHHLKRTWDWETIFAIIQGHRFIWWRSERHFDDGDAPLGGIFFAGHSGLAGLSPLDLREFTKDEMQLVVSVFGRGAGGQQKIALRTPDLRIKSALEDAVLLASSDVKND